MSTPKSQPRGTGLSGDDLFASSYKKHSQEISILMGSFFLRYLGAIYKEFSGDLAMVIVLGEIGHHNISHCYSGQGATCRVDLEKIRDHTLWQRLHPCNAFSLSAATGIPRETVRRKIDTLVSKGWLRRNSKGEVFITEAVARHFHSDFDPRLLREILELAARVQAFFSDNGDLAKPKETPDSAKRQSPPKS